jgi:hypothetical protein
MDDCDRRIKNAVQAAIKAERRIWLHLCVYQVGENNWYCILTHAHYFTEKLALAECRKLLKNTKYLLSIGLDCTFSKLHPSY